MCKSGWQFQFIFTSSSLQAIGQNVCIIVKLPMVSSYQPFVSFSALLTADTIIDNSITHTQHVEGSVPNAA